MKVSPRLVEGIGLAFLSALVMPLMMLNIFSGLVGGIWLAILGKWKLIGAGLLLSFAMPWAYAIISLPAFGLAALAILAKEKGSKINLFVLGFLSSIYNYVLLSLWNIVVLSNYLRGTESGSFVPHLLWAYSIAMAPLGYMASKEPPDSTGTTIGLFFAEVCFIILAISWFFRIPFKSSILIISVLIIILSFIISIFTVSPKSE